MKPTTESPDALLARLEEISAGLLFPSESDAPLTPFRWEAPEGTELGPEALLVTLGLPAGTRVETTTVADVLEPFTELSASPSPEDEEDAKRFRAILDLLESALQETRAYRVGEVDIDVYLLGKHPGGGWMGLKTHAVET